MERILFSFVSENPTKLRREFENIVMSTRRPDSYDFRAVRAEILKHMAQAQELDMAALQGY